MDRNSSKRWGRPLFFSLCLLSTFAFAGLLHITPQKSSGGFRDNYSVRLDGVNDYLDGGNSVSSIDFERTDPFWLHCNIYVRGIETDDLGKQEIIGKVMDSASGTLPHNGYHLRFVSDNTGYVRRIAFYLVSKFQGGDNRYMGIVSSDGAIQLNRWYTVDAANTDGTAANAKMWINKVLQTTTTESDNVDGTIKSTAKFTIGSRNGVENFFNGDINDCMVAGFVPTQTDIDNVWNANRSRTSLANVSLSGGSPLAWWWFGDSDTLPTITARMGSYNLTATNGPTLVNATQAIAPSIDTSWTPLVADGDVDLWLDGDDNVTSSGGAVSQWVDKSSHAYVYSQSGSNKPTVTTLNGHGALESDGTQYLTMASPTRLTSNGVAFAVGVAARADSVSAPTQFPGIWMDGNGSTQALKLGLSNHADYSDLWFGQESGGINQFRWGFSLSVPQAVTAVIDSDGQNNTTSGVSGWVNGSYRTTTSAGTYASETGGGRLFNIGSTYTLDGKIGGVVLINNPSLSDVMNLQAYMVRRWSP